MSNLAQMEQTEKTEQEQQSSEPSKGFLRSGIGRWILLAVVIVVAVGGYFVWQHYSVRESTDDAEIDGHIHPISAKEFGTVIHVNVDDNQFVKAGTVLVEFDPRDYQVAFDKAKADLAEAEAALTASHTDVPITVTSTSSKLSGSEADVEQARAGLASSKQQVAAAQARLKSVQANVRQAEANYQKAAKDVERFKPLLAKEEISQQQYDSAVATANALQAELAAAEAQVSVAEEGIRVAQSAVNEQNAKVAAAEAANAAAKSGPQQVAATKARANSAAARVQQARANLEAAQRGLDKTITRAPIDGYIENRVAEVGQVVQPGQPLLSIVPMHDIWVTANFKESQLKNMRIGQPVTISVDAYGGRKYKGHVDSFAATTGAKASLLPPENATGNYVKVVQRVPVKIVLDEGQDPEHLLRPGMSVEPTVLTK